MTETWGQWFRGNFDKFLLISIWATWIFMIYMAAFGKADAESIHWFRENANTVQGALLGMITGISIARRDPPPGAVSQTTTRTTVQEAQEEKQ